MCKGTDACRDTEIACVDDDHDCTLTCSGYYACYGMTIYGPREVTCTGYEACSGMTIHGPPDPHTLTVTCTGGGIGQTCYGLKVHGEASAAVRFACGTTDGTCGEYADIFCPGCAQDAEGGCSTGGSGSESGSGVGKRELEGAHLRLGDDQAAQPRLAMLLGEVVDDRVDPSSRERGRRALGDPEARGPERGLLQEIHRGLEEERHRQQQWQGWQHKRHEALIHLSAAAGAEQSGGSPAQVLHQVVAERAAAGHALPRPHH